jgi:anti-sigma B factor antagonist
MPGGDSAAPLGMLTASVAAGESGPVMTLSGEADIATAAQLSALVTAQLARGTRCLTIDVSELSFADSMSIGILVLAARTLKERGGGLVLLRPQQVVARILEIMGADQVITIRGEARGEPESEGRAGW